MDTPSIAALFPNAKEAEKPGKFLFTLNSGLLAKLWKVTRNYSNVEILPSGLHCYQFPIYPLLVSSNAKGELLQFGKILAEGKGMWNRKRSDQFCQ